MKHARLWILPLLLVTAAGLAGCGANGFQLPGLRIVATPAVMNAQVGQRCVFLVRVSHQDSAGPVTITASAPTAVAEVEPESITADQICEVTITPSASSLGTAIAVSIQAAQGTQTDSETPTIHVIAGTDGLGFAAGQLRDRFVAWLQANRPDFGITTDTTWTGTIVQPDVTTAAHYLYFSDQWELGLAWRITVPPGDWAQMYLRKRFQQLRPSYALEIVSVSGGSPPTPNGPPRLPYR